MMDAFIISQVLIGIAFLSDVASFQFRDRKITLLLFFFSATLISIHFFLLDAQTAGFISLISALRYFVSIFTVNQKLKYLFLFLTVFVGAATFDGYEDVFIIITGIFGTLAAFQSNARILRLYMMVATISVIIHNIIIWTPAGIALEVFFLGSNLISYYRFYTRKK